MNHVDPLPGYNRDQNSKLVTVSIDNMQSTLKCCGAYNATDWDKWRKKQEDKTQVNQAPKISIRGHPYRDFENVY